MIQMGSRLLDVLIVAIGALVAIMSTRKWR